MKKVYAAVAALVVAVTVSGCEACNGGLTNSSSNLAHQIIPEVEKICGHERDSAPHGGVMNIMLMDGREDDGIVTCFDGTNHYFDA